MINNDILKIFEELDPLIEEFHNLGGNDVALKVLDELKLMEEFRGLSPEDRERKLKDNIEILRLAMKIGDKEKLLVSFANNDTLYLGMHQALYKAVKVEDFSKAAGIKKDLENHKIAV